MRRYLPTELRRRFDIAWHLIPDSICIELRHFLRHIRAVTSLQGAAFRRADGTICISENDGGAWFMVDDSVFPRRGYIFIHADFQYGPEVSAVLTILHELAHAVEYMQDDWKAEMRQDIDSEIAAWLQVGAWAARNLSAYQEANSIVKMAIQLANSELKQEAGYTISKPFL